MAPRHGCGFCASSTTNSPGPRAGWEEHSQSRWHSAGQHRVKSGLRATFHHFSKNVVCLLAMALLDALHANLVSQIDRGPQTPERRDVRSTDPLKALGTQLGLFPTFGGDG